MRGGGQFVENSVVAQAGKVRGQSGRDTASGHNTSASDVGEVVNETLGRVHRPPTTATHVPARQLSLSLLGQVDFSATTANVLQPQDALIDRLEDSEDGLVHRIGNHGAKVRRARRETLPAARHWRSRLRPEESIAVANRSISNLLHQRLGEFLDL